jgi:glucose/arabinose dehydrogenase
LAGLDLFPHISGKFLAKISSSRAVNSHATGGLNRVRVITASAIGTVIVCVLAIVLLVLAGGTPREMPGTPSGTPAFISLPHGFVVSIFTDDVPGARSIAIGEAGTVFIGTRDKGVVYAVQDINNDGRVERIFTIAKGLFMPNGVAFQNGSLYVAEVNRIIRFDNIEDNLDHPPKAVTVFSSLPSETAHGWKFIRFGPDGRLYIPVGMPCNICDPPDSQYGTILRIQADGSGEEVFARGIRNTVGFDWDPKTGDLWFTENGRDWLGDDLPPDELNHAPFAGLDFGFPEYYGNCMEDPEYTGKQHSADCTPAALDFPAHVAPLGMRFYTGTLFPEEYHNAIFIAEHGSWNRKTPIGYQVVTVRLENGHISQAVPFATGFLGADGTVRGRPVDVAVMPDGALLVSDDYAGRIYRISYGGS